MSPTYIKNVLTQTGDILTETFSHRKLPDSFIDYLALTLFSKSI